MPTQYEDDDDEFDTEDSAPAEETALVKDLRKQLRAAKKENADLTAKVAEFASTSRERTVKEVLTAKGVKPGIAKFIPADVTDEAGVVAWLDENAEDLGIQVASGDGDDSDDGPDPELNEARRVQALSQRATTPTAMQAALKELGEADDDAAFEAAFHKAAKALL